MASPEEIPKEVCGEASRHTSKASPAHYILNRPQLFVPTGHHAGEHWPHAVHYLRRCFRTNVPQDMSNVGERSETSPWRRLQTRMN